jgi:hypothetical protein
VAARSLVGLAGLPTIVATGPFDNQPYAEQLAAAFAMVRLRCRAQLVLVGTGAHRATIMRRSFAQGAGTLIAGADVVVSGPGRVLTTLSLRHGISCRARQVARRRQLQRLSLQRNEKRRNEHVQHP